MLRDRIWPDLPVETGLVVSIPLSDFPTNILKKKIVRLIISRKYRPVCVDAKLVLSNSFTLRCQMIIYNF